MFCNHCQKHYRREDVNIDDTICRIDPDMGVVCRVPCPHCNVPRLFRQVIAYYPADERRETHRT